MSVPITLRASARSPSVVGWPEQPVRRVRPDDAGRVVIARAAELARDVARGQHAEDGLPAVVTVRDLVEVIQAVGLLEVRADRTVSSSCARST